MFQQLPIKLYEAPPLETWAVLYIESEESLATKFIQTLNESLQAFNYNTKQPILVKVP